MKVLIISSLLVASCLGYYTFRQSIPNGEKVLNPCGSDTDIWAGVGHKAQSGGGERNAFGEDFAKAGMTWSTALCEKDSDNDGRSNGEELGDPACKWTPGASPSGKVTGHPGICEPYNSDKCRNFKFDIPNCPTGIGGIVIG